MLPGYLFNFYELSGECSQHEWIDAPGDWDLGGDRAQVVCSVCGVSGERNDKTGEVYWPAT